MKKVRQDDLADLSIPTWALVRQAILAGEAEDALELIEYEVTGANSMHDILIRVCDDFVTHIATIPVMITTALDG